MKAYFLFFLLLSSLALHAQDRLLLTDGQDMPVWITELGENYVKYIHADQGEDAEFNLPKRMVYKIIYATGEELSLNPMELPQEKPEQSAVAVVSEPVKIQSLTPEPVQIEPSDVLRLTNGGTIDAIVTEITDDEIEYKVGENIYTISTVAVASISYSDGTEERFSEPDPIAEAEAARKSAQEHRQKRKERQAQLISSNPFESNSSKASAKEEKTQENSPFEIRLSGGINLITGVGQGSRDLAWKLQLTQATLPSSQFATSLVEWKPTAGIHLGFLSTYTLNPHVKLLAGLEVSQKGYIALTTLSFQKTSSEDNWVLLTREREQMVHLDIPLGIEVQLRPYLELQAGLLASIVLNGSVFVKEDTDVYTSEGTRLDDVSGNTTERQTYEGIAATTGGFIGFRIPLTSRIGTHLRMVSNVGGGFSGALANTVFQAGLEYRL